MMGNRGMNRFYALGLFFLALTLVSCYYIRVEEVPIYWIYPWNLGARRMARAVIEEDVEQIDKLVQSGRVDVNLVARDETSFLYIAVKLDKKQSFVKLLDLGADIYWGSIDYSPIYLAAGHYAEIMGDLYYLEEALKRGLDPSYRLNFGITAPIYSPLESPVRSESGIRDKGTRPENYLAKLKLMISYGADMSLPDIGPSESFPSGSGGNVVSEAAREGYYNAVYYLLTEFEGIQYKDHRALNVKTNEYEYYTASILTYIEKIANADNWGVPLGRVQESTYPWFLKTIEWLESRGEVLDIPEDLSRILTIKLDTTQKMKNYRIDRDGNITPKN